MVERASACAGKVSYRSGKDAAKAKDGMCRRKTAGPRPMLQIYRCQLCSQWHLGREVKGNLKAKKREGARMAARIARP